TYANLPIADAGEALTCYHIDMQVDERTGVLAAISSEFAANGVSLRTVRQEGSEDDARLIVVTHTAREAVLRNIVETLTNLDVVKEVKSVLRLDS
ncbi:MAG: ACT domain-containing protein, partial [Corynebacterium casei]|nr:ACT domain-containing protein [Corynebacterium casei]